MCRVPLASKRAASFNQTQHWSACLHLKTIPVETDFRAILKRFDATLQLGGTVGIRSDSRTHGQSISLCSKHMLFPPQRCSFALAV
jgi:hypothetical protein